MEKCWKCNGEGIIQTYIKYNNGVCYECNGVGFLFDTKEEEKIFYENEEDRISAELDCYYELSEEDYAEMEEEAYYDDY